MNRLLLSIARLSFTVAIAIPGIATAQFVMPEEATVIPIAEGLHVIRGAGGNIALSTGPDGVFIVDNDIPDVRDQISRAIATVTDQPVDMVINTHWHFDHTGNNKLFAERGARILAHRNVRERMSTEQIGYFRGERVVSPPAPEAARPVITYDREMTLHLNGQTVRIRHVEKPAHTDGDSIIYFEEANAIHMGDNFFVGLYPVIDIASGGNADGMIAVMDEVLAEVGPDTVIIPGHGPVSDAEGLRKFRDMLDTVNKRIRLLVEEGKTEDEVVALKPTVNFDEEWAWDIMTPEVWTRLMYTSVRSTMPAEE